MSTMSLAEPFQPAIAKPGLPPAPPPGDRIAFVGNRRAYWRLMIRGAMLLAVTLGIYRFWLFTDMRRFMWANTEIDGESLEYTGTAVELLLGFLMAMGILVPTYGLIFVGTLELGMISQFSSFLGFGVLFVFGQYAIYRARRYRLTRTTLRGVRFHQTGSGFSYAFRALLWSIPNVLTLGLTYPWSAASLERYKMRHTFYGDTGGQFAGTGSRLFLRGIGIWIAMVAPVVIGLTVAAAVLDWHAVARTVSSVHGPALAPALGKIKSFMIATGVAGAGVLVSSLLVVILYPAFQAIVMRWWLAGVRIGDAVAASDLRMRRVYGAWFRYVLYLLALSVILSLAVAAVGFAGKAMGIDLKSVSTAVSGAASAAGVAGYVVFILAASTIFQVVVKFRLWQVAAESVTITNLASLGNVRAHDAVSSAVGEGLADALLGAGAI